jgi:hypothetical protein
MSMIGHNQPPLGERLEIDHASLAQQASDVLALDALPPIMVDDDLAIYSERAKALKGVAGMIEKARKAEKDQILKDGRTIDDFFGKLTKPVKDAADAIVAKINDWQRKKLEAERKARAEQERKEQEAARIFGDEPPPLSAPVAAKEAARVVASSGRVTAAASTVWRHRVVDPEKLPRRFLMPNDAAIKAAIAGGAREIPGVEVFEEVRTVIR